jgi:hypothetical protein
VPAAFALVALVALVASGSAAVWLMLDDRTQVTKLPAAHTM